jgi:hypothetical protein
MMNEQQKQQVSAAATPTTTTTTTTTTTRRGFMTAAGIAAITATTGTATARAEQEAEYRQGIKVDAFNGLIFNVSWLGFDVCLFVCLSKQCC